MSRPTLFHLSGNPWANGLRLIVLNIAIAVFCIAGFLGTLFVVSSANSALLARGGEAAGEIPFPYPVLLIGDAVLFVIAWAWFGGRLPDGGRGRLLTSVLGAGPLWGLGLLGYVAALAAAIGNDIAPEQMGAAAFFVFGLLATLLVLAGVVCIAVIALAGVGRRGSLTAASGEAGVGR